MVAEKGETGKRARTGTSRARSTSGKVRRKGPRSSGSKSSASDAKAFGASKSAKPAAKSAKPAAKTAKAGRAKSGTATTRKTVKASTPGSDGDGARRTTRKEQLSAAEAERMQELEDALAEARGAAEKAFVAAELVVATINSEKTVSTRLEQAKEEDRVLAEVTHAPPNPEHRRSARDQFKFFRKAWRAEDKDDPFEDWRARNDEPRHRLGSGATVEALQAAERRLNVDFPASYWDFCLEFGSGDLFVGPWRRTRFIAAPDLWDEIKSVLADRMLYPFMPIIDPGGGDVIALDTGQRDDRGECPVVWWFNGDVQAVVADDFCSFLERFQGARGDRFWLEG